MWKALGPFGKLRFFFYLVREMRQARLMKQEELESLTEQQEVFEALEELAERFPALKRTLVDERDAHMAARIKECGGKKVVVVLGAGHLLGVTRLLQMAP
jgi:pheromone shutdown protein TraB